MKDKNQTIGNLIDKQSVAFISSVDMEGYPNTKAMLPPRKREGIKTFYFSFVGIIILYILNLFRIYVLNVIVVKFPEYVKPAHDYFFPAIIYGGVVLLWLIWINKFVIKDDVVERTPEEN